MAVRVHPFPSRTRQLSSLALKILGWKRPGKIRRCRHKEKQWMFVHCFFRCLKNAPPAELVVMAVDTFLYCYVLACMYRLSCMDRFFGYLLLELGPCYASTSPASGCACCPLFAGMLPSEWEARPFFPAGGGAAFCFHLLFNTHLLCAWGRAAVPFWRQKGTKDRRRGSPPSGTPLGLSAFLARLALISSPQQATGEAAGGYSHRPAGLFRRAALPVPDARSQMLDGRR